MAPKRKGTKEPNQDRRSKASKQSKGQTSKSEQGSDEFKSHIPAVELSKEVMAVVIPTTSTSKKAAPVSALAARKAARAAAASASATSAAPEPATEKVIKTSAKEKSKSAQRPISALAARRAAKAAGASTATASPSPEPIDVQQDTSDLHPADDEDDANTSDEGMPSPVSVTRGGESEQDIVMADTEPVEATLDMGASSSEDNKSHNTAITPLKRMEPKKQRSLYLDPHSVSRFTPSDTNVLPFEKDGDHYLLLGLKSEEDIVFVGNVLIAPLFGAITVMGATLSSQYTTADVSSQIFDLSFYPIYSPKTHALLRLQPIDGSQKSTLTQDRAPLKDKINLKNITGSSSLISAVKGFSTVVVLRDMHWNGIADVEQILPMFKGIFDLDRTKDMTPLNHIPGFYPVLSVTAGLKAIQIPVSWSTQTKHILSSSTDRPKPGVSVVCGSQKMGKSSFARYLTNRLLDVHRRVAFLEADLGQTEFTAPGMIALHVLDQPILGPPFTHQHWKPMRSYFIGSTSPKDDPSYYMDCLTELLQIWRFNFDNDAADQESEKVPLVVNTHGWTRGLGYDLLLSIIQKAIPTDICVFQSSIASRNLPASFTTSVYHSDNPMATVQSQPPTLHYLESAVAYGTFADKYHGADHRNLSLVSYFHQQVTSFYKPGQRWWDFRTRLVEKVPWSVDWRQGFNGIWVLNNDVPLRDLLYTLNGSIVALIGDVVDGEQVDGPNNQVTIQPRGEKASIELPKYYSSLDYPPPPPQATTCHGLAIVRAIDPSRHAMLLLTPLPVERLKKVSGLVKGDIELPIWCMLDHRNGAGGGIAGVPWRQVSYVTVENVEGVGGGAIRVRRNLMRRSQITL
ncbi:uncharacterized protein BYT42DRAFT_129126 [Radiomyces spectabilis]|uniref:uncharacterized protein n=1 Tax=Radiomyces spectabilis TaxID=64574 RepID=UPI00221EC7EC|nr:uncharacterized protein BYT42DRAFT_129126 [Radiomyces spectabilis]KAI8367514.1 hypothetical protein BYT42DRAFT_129126 [Radiomyces spectabilis]